MRTGARRFAVYADEVEATSENSRPTPLPFAPAPVRGVVSRRGRMLTLIDPLPLLPPGDARCLDQPLQECLVQRHALPFQRVRAEPNNSAMSRQSAGAIWLYPEGLRT